jgi:nicotinamide-nucleotide amidase
VSKKIEDPLEDPLLALAARLGAAALARGTMIATAESCTGGLVAGAITSIAGSSGWFERGFVTYSDLAKEQQLGVASSTIERFGAVSEETAKAMAQGAVRSAAAQWAVAVTGIAGPDGGSPDKPVGTVWFAWAGPDHLQALKRQFDGDRAAVRQASIRVALEGLIDRLA